MENGCSVGFILLELLVIIFFIAVLWKVFTKAGQPGWACLIPIYNLYIFIKIAGKPGWWLLLFFIPLVNMIIDIIINIEIAHNFGKGTGFGIGLILLPFIFLPILAFGEAEFRG